MTTAKDLDSNAWIDAGLAAILKGGISAVAVEPLARALKVTKGSFYWHFKDRNALLSAMAERWGNSTEQLIAGVADRKDPAARLEALILAVHHSKGGLRTMRTMAALAGHPSTAAAIRTVAGRQHTFLAKAFSEMGLSPKRAQAAARLVHSATLGVGELEPLGIGFANTSDRDNYLAELLAFVRATAANRTSTSRSTNPRK